MNWSFICLWDGWNLCTFEFFPFSLRFLNLYMLYVEDLKPCFDIMHTQEMLIWQIEWIENEWWIFSWILLVIFFYESLSWFLDIWYMKFYNESRFFFNQSSKIFFWSFMRRFFKKKSCLLVYTYSNPSWYDFYAIACVHENIHLIIQLILLDIHNMMKWNYAWNTNEKLIIMHDRM